MAISKVTLNGDTLMDVTQDTVTANNLLSGETATGADGEQVVGELVVGQLTSLTVTPTTSQQVFQPNEATLVGTIYVNDESNNFTKSVDLSAFDIGDVCVITGAICAVSSGATVSMTDLSGSFVWAATNTYVKGLFTFTITSSSVSCNYSGQGQPYGVYDNPDGVRRIGFRKASPYTGYDTVTVNPIPSQYIVPSGTKTITENGTGIDVASYASVDVNVSGGGSGTVDEKQINFIDYDGTILYSYTEQEFAALSELPENPSHAGLIAQGWNWTKAQITSQLSALPGESLCVGQMYNTASGATEIDITLDDANFLSPWLCVAVNGTITVNWGDGSSPDIITGTSQTVAVPKEHVYSSLGNYTITLTANSGNYVFYGSSAEGVGVLRSTSLTGNKTYNRTYSNAIKRIRIGDALLVSSYMFVKCTKLESITIPARLTGTGDYMFSYCDSLKSVTIPYGTTNISDYAFQYCTSLSYISLPCSVTQIGSYSISNCRLLKTVPLPFSVTTINTNAFTSLYHVNSVKISSNVATIGRQTFSNSHGIKYITILSNINTIPQYFANNCYSLAGLVLSGETTTIDTYAFSGCQSLQTLTIPAKVDSIGANAFSGCYSLVEIHFLPTTPPTVASANAWTNLPADCVIYVPTGTLSAYTSATNYPDPATYTYIEE